MSEKGRKSKLDVGYLRVATSNSLASSIFAVGMQEEEQHIVQEKLPQQNDINLPNDNPSQLDTTREVKLKATLSYLNDYQQSVSEQTPPSAEERALLQHIITLARALLADG